VATPPQGVYNQLTKPEQSGEAISMGELGGDASPPEVEERNQIPMSASSRPGGAIEGASQIRSPPRGPEGIKYIREKERCPGPSR